MKKTELIFGTYNGLPPGSTDVEFENAYQRAYKPFLTTLYKYPNVSAAIYYSGTLLTWLHEHHPEFLMLLNDMVKRSQIELLGGAFHEPILPLIPASDRSGQIELLTTYLRRRFGKRPRGIWLPELAWEPSLPVSLKNCGMEYSFLDSAAFEAADIPIRRQYKPARTEDQGKSLEIFPVHSRLAPMRSIESDRIEPEQYMKRIFAGCPADEDSVVVVFDAGEALGLWSLNDLLYSDDGWLSGFFEQLSGTANGIHTVLPKEYSRRPHRTERCYFGSSQMDELTDWWFSADPEKKDTNAAIRKRARQLLPTGSLRQIIRRYPESAHLYSKMTHVHILVNQIRGDRYRKKAAREELWKGQSGYALWHGKTDGIQRNGIRKAAYTALIEAEKIAREEGIFKEYASREDFDLDGLDEYLFVGNILNVYIHTVGGPAFELDYLPSSWNYLDTMGRYEEPYHGSIIPNHIFDTSPRCAFVDRVMPTKSDFASYQQGADEITDDISTHVFDVTEYKRDHMEVGLATTWDDRLSIRKKFSLSGSELRVAYSLKNYSESTRLTESFLTEINLSFASNNEEFLQLRAYNDQGETLILRDASESENILRFDATDMKNAVTVATKFDSPCEMWNLPIISQWYAKSGKRSGYQASAFCVRRSLTLDPGESLEFSICLDFQR